MLSILEFVQNKVQSMPGGKVRMTVPINVRRASLSRAVPSVPNKNQMGIGNLTQMRKKENVSPITGTRVSATGLRLMGRNPTPGTRIMSPRDLNAIRR